MKRSPINLNHYSFTTGRFGMLQTLSVIPVIAGDSLTVNMNNVLRMSDLRRTLTVDAQIDYFGFYVPHRHSYGSLWTDLVKEGVTSSVVLPTVNIGSGTYYLGQVMDFNNEDIAQWRITAYNQIWNRYFRFLTLTPEVPLLYNGSGTPSGHSLAVSPLKGSDDQRHYGFNCARLKTPWTTGIVSSLVAADREVPSATVLDIIELKQIQKQYKNLIDLDWFANRYNDVLGNQFGSGVNIDADERPKLIFRTTKSLSGVDVNGTDDATIGTSVGKSVQRHQLGFRRQFMPEHGSVWLMALVRFPTISTRESHPLGRENVGYKDLVGNYDVVSAEPPLTQNLLDWMAKPAGTTPIGTIPYGQFYRHQPNNVHVDFEILTGFPFLKPVLFNTHMEAVYVHETDYDSSFLSDQLGHWQNYASIQVEAMRHYPSARTSIYAGTT